MNFSNKINFYLVILPAPLSSTRPYYFKKSIVPAGTIEGFTVFTLYFRGEPGSIAVQVKLTYLSFQNVGQIGLKIDQ